MAIKALRRVEEMVAAKLPVEQVKHEALKMGARGLRLLVDGALTAVKAVERFQGKLEQMPQAAAQPQPTPMAQTVVEDSELLREQIHATAERVLDEARAVEQRLNGARPARRPIQVTVEADVTQRPARAKGRRLASSANVSPKRVTAPTGGFKAKRGQKHSHSH